MFVAWLAGGCEPEPSEAFRDDGTDTGSAAPLDSNSSDGDTQDSAPATQDTGPVLQTCVPGDTGPTGDTATTAAPWCPGPGDSGWPVDSGWASEPVVADTGCPWNWYWPEDCPELTNPWTVTGLEDFERAEASLSAGAFGGWTSDAASYGCPTWDGDSYVGGCSTPDGRLYFGSVTQRYGRPNTYCRWWDGFEVTTEDASFRARIHGVYWSGATIDQTWSHTRRYTEMCGGQPWGYSDGRRLKDAADHWANGAWSERSWQSAVGTGAHDGEFCYEMELAGNWSDCYGAEVQGYVSIIGDAEVMLTWDAVECDGCGVVTVDGVPTCEYCEE